MSAERFYVDMVRSLHDHIDVINQEEVIGAVTDLGWGVSIHAEISRAYPFVVQVTSDVNHVTIVRGRDVFDTLRSAVRDHCKKVIDDDASKSLPRPQPTRTLLPTEPETI